MQAAVLPLDLPAQAGDPHLLAYMAGGEGIGPSFTAPKAAVLPLDDPPAMYAIPNKRSLLDGTDNLLF